MHDIMRLWLLILFGWCPAAVWSHARLMSPPSRSSMWRVGFPTRRNFNDNALYCGGIGTQWKRNGGKCGICGDPYNMPHPRDNEAGGKYGKGIISKKYISGQVMEATVEVTTNHRGFFEFKLCPNNDSKREASQECLDKHVLKEAHGIGTRYYIADRGKGDITVKLQLPKGLTCSQCVFQWTYVAGNNWGLCEDGESRLGCGPQETFRGCADIAVETSTDIFSFGPKENDVNSDTRSRPNPPFKPRRQNRTKTTTRNPNNVFDKPRDSRSTTPRPPPYDRPSHHHKDFHHNRGGYPPPTAWPGSTSAARPLLDKKNQHRTTKRRKYPKYDNRYYYRQTNSGKAGRQVTGRQKPKRKLPVMDNPAFLGGSAVTADPYYPSPPLRRPEKPYTHAMDHALMKFMNSESEDDSLAQVAQAFNLGGRRYKDFWQL